MKNPMRQSASRLGILLAVTLAATACGGASQLTKKASASASTSATRTQATATRVCGGGTTPRGTVTYGIAGAGITKLDPNTLSFAGQAPLQTLLYDGLTKYNRTMQTVPDLAKSWKSSTDLKTWWFYLRKGVEYSNGSALTAADVVANLERVLNPATHSQARLALEDITSVTAVNDHEIEIKLSAPDALLPTALIKVKMSYTKDLQQLNTTGIGTGPYKVSKFVPGETLTVVPNQHYWGQKACLAKIQFIREPDTTSMVTAFKDGALNIMWQVPPADVPTVQSAPGASIVTPSGASGSHVFELDTTSPPFNNPLARKALSYATDRQAMVKAAFFGLATVSPANDLLSTKNPSYNKSLPAYPFDLQKAKSLFEKAGVKPGTTFTFWALAGRRPEWITMAEILQQDLAKIGYHLKIERNDVTTWLAKFYPAGKRYPGVIVANYFSLPPAPSFALQQAEAGKCECNWQDPQFQALAKKALATASGAQRRQIYGEMQALFSKAVPLIVVAQETNVVAVNSHLRGVWEDALGNVHLSGAWLSGKS